MESLVLPPDSRTTLLTQLIPPPGYRLGQLVGTTFTMDLESALLPCLALAGRADVEGADDIETIAALRSCIGAIDVFHQTGAVAVPKDRTRLFSLLEDSIHGVSPARGIFHPKVWIELMSGDGNDRVRLIVLSRNLTKDRSWDIAATLDGNVGTLAAPQNNPLVALVRHLVSSLGSRIKPHRAQRLSELATTLQYVHWELPDGATAVDFHVFGIPGVPTAAPDFSGNRHLVVSPFLHTAGLNRIITDACGPIAVVSRQESFHGLSKDVSLRISDAFVLSPTAGIPAEDQAASDYLPLTGLHAKIYAIDRGRHSHLFVGSPNATGAAFSANVELLLEVTGRRKVYGVDQLLGSSGFLPILERFDIGAAEPPPTDEKQRSLDSYLRAICTVPIVGRLAVDDSVARLALTSETPLGRHDDDITISLSLLTDRSTATVVDPGTRVAIELTHLDLVDVTAFVVIAVEDSRGLHSATVVKCQLVGDVARRLDAIVTVEINDADAFRRFLALLLAFGEAGHSPGDETENGDGSGGSWTQLEQGLFEQLLRASTTRPEILEQLSGVVTTIVKNGDPKRILPAGFADLWTALQEATMLGTAHD